MSEVENHDHEISWQKKWEEANIFSAEKDESKPAFYCLEMYPYPSGKMHMGHVRNYSIGDAIARYKRLMGFNVLYPMGFDSFGMPAENAAIAEGGDPQNITERNMASITEQIKRMGFSYDWSRLIKSHDPHYYRWNQWFFLKFLEKGLAYQSHAPVNWCDDCQTVLANEQVKAGRCWRCNDPVIQKDMSQWFLDIPQYAQELLDGLDTIAFPENVAALQRDWLGKSEGVEITFEIDGYGEKVSVFTTRPDTLFGVTFLTLAPEHPIAEELVKNSEYESAWKELYDEVSIMTEFDRIKNMNKKKGVPLGASAIHPLTGEKIPIWAGNFVIASYGTGAVMAVPGHDERDFDFANRYGIPVKRVLVMDENDPSDKEITKAETNDGWMVNSHESRFDGLYGKEARDAVCSALEENGLGKRQVNWKIRPWLISRQRYWGTPIPIVHCRDCGAVPVPEDDLPVTLPNNVVFDGKGNPLEKSESFVNTSCPKCELPARRETDTMDTFVDSSWYFFRYTDALNQNEAFSHDVANYWMNVNFYCGGIEHAQMHLIYARFWTKALRDLGLHSLDEPFHELLCQGMVNKSAPWCNQCAITLHVSHQSGNCPHCNSPLSERSAKMSKSLGNTVSPELMIQKFGADTIRLFILFAANPTAGMDWSDQALEANHRQMLQLKNWPESIFAWEHKVHQMDEWLLAKFRQQVREWKRACEGYDLRRAVEISHYDLPKVFNWYRRRGGSNQEIGLELLKAWTHMISIITPHLAENWWQELKHTDLVSGRIFDFSDNKLAQDQNLLDQEKYIRQFLEQARKIAKIASKHLGGAPQRATIVPAETWKSNLSRHAIKHISSGSPVKAFVSIIEPSMLDSQVDVKDAKIFWGQKLLKQIFKWNDEEKRMIEASIDEVSIIKSSQDFIKSELNLDELIVDTSQTRDSKSMPLSPSIIYG